MTEKEHEQSARLPRARSVERREERRARAQQAPRRVARSFVQLPKKFSPKGLIIAAGLAIFLAFSISTPLRNYFEQRSELAEINSTIAAQEQRKAELTDELNRYSNEDYIKEQARTRLGLIEPGESAFRIISPSINSSAPDPALDDEAAEDDKRWYTKLWDSISIPEDELTPEESTTGDVENHHLPTVPAP
ncbi:MAG TPA: septum formation initiator family protein [Candidatus Corynebacterium gallistercoris]|uniref:Septum formation initiator family protein n=1 Tax=Candidatus Corynebacterium gallistercoris TaxID=2838530 RepID=A0A9D1RY49_9CORY|nr:septum formation initiator family protein [Candidatus Corynebacterium gallistercoris]